MGQDHAFVDVRAGDRFVSVLEVIVQQPLLNLEGDLQRLQSVLVLPVFFVDAAEVVEAERPELQQLFLGAQVVPDWLVEEHVDALGDQVELLAEVHAAAGHDLDVDLVDEGGQFLQERQSLRQRLFVLKRRGNQVDQSLVHQYLRELLRLVLQVLVVLLQKQQGLLVLFLLPQHRARLII